MAFGDADRHVFTNPVEFGCVVVCGGITGAGVLAEADEMELPGGVTGQLGRARSVKVATGVFTLTLGAAITVDGTAYTIRDVREEPPTGRFTRVWLHN